MSIRWNLWWGLPGLRLQHQVAARIRYLAPGVVLVNTPERSPLQRRLSRPGSSGLRDGGLGLCGSIPGPGPRALTLSLGWSQKWSCTEEQMSLLGSRTQSVSIRLRLPLVLDATHPPGAHRRRLKDIGKR